MEGLREVALTFRECSGYATGLFSLVYFTLHVILLCDVRVLYVEW